MKRITEYSNENVHDHDSSSNGLIGNQNTKIKFEEAPNKANDTRIH